MAERVLSDADLPNWAAGFHLQQAAEKALKAILVAHGRPPPRTHDLGLLVEAAETFAPALGGWADRLLSLGDFAVSHRYPGAPEPMLDLARSVADIRELLAVVERECLPK